MTAVKEGMSVVITCVVDRHRNGTGSRSVKYVSFWIDQLQPEVNENLHAQARWKTWRRPNSRTPDVIKILTSWSLSTQVRLPHYPSASAIHHMPSRSSPIDQNSQNCEPTPRAAGRCFLTGVVCLFISVSVSVLV